MTTQPRNSSLIILLMHFWLFVQLLIMPITTIGFSETDAVKLVLEFLQVLYWMQNNLSIACVLQKRQLHIAMLALERETGVINGQYSHDMIFMRQLVLGQCFRTFSLFRDYKDNLDAIETIIVDINSFFKPRRCVGRYHWLHSTSCFHRKLQHEELYVHCDQA